MQVLMCESDRAAIKALKHKPSRLGLQMCRWPYILKLFPVSKHDILYRSIAIIVIVSVFRCIICSRRRAVYAEK